MNNQLDRAHHTFFCLAAFVCWYVLSYAALLIPGYSSLYQSGLAVVVMHLCLLLPCALIFWHQYSKRYFFLPLGRLAWRDLPMPILALFGLVVVHALFGRAEPWIGELPAYSPMVKVALAITFVVLAPINEEIIFRGLLLNASIGWGPHAKTAGIVSTSLIFSLIHSQYVMPTTFVWLFIFSAMLCVVRIHTRGLIVPIILHGMFNGLSAAATLL
ncbi:CPBP family intramembrane glutamic endopeptidase [Leminorella richardii]|nr:type II CAAX endopeptidase family protein [Leminorella richardii]